MAVNSKPGATESGVKIKIKLDKEQTKRFLECFVKEALELAKKRENASS